MLILEDILVLGEGPTQGLHDTIITAKYSIRNNHRFVRPTYLALIEWNINMHLKRTYSLLLTLNMCSA